MAKLMRVTRQGAATLATLLVLACSDDDSTDTTGAYSLAVTPAVLTVSQGGAGVATVSLTRIGGFGGPVTLAVIGALPLGAKATYTPDPVTGNSSALQITTPATAADGNYSLYLTAIGKDPAGVLRFANVTVTLVVQRNGKDFAISGNVSGQLAPGVSRPLDLTLTNPNKKPISVTNLTVALTSVTRTQYAVAHNLPCGPVDYRITQYAGTYPLTVPGDASAALSGLHVPQSAWPQVAMLNTASNQDGCKGATLKLTYSGSGSGS